MEKDDALIYVGCNIEKGEIILIKDNELYDNSSNT